LDNIQKHIAFKDEELKANKYEDQYISRFGSHFSIKISNDGRGILPVGLGPLNTELPLYLGLDIEDERFSLPLHYLPGFNNDNNIENLVINRTMNTLTLVKEDDLKGIKAEWKFISPFYPKEKLLSTAPFFYIKTSIKNNSSEEKNISILSGLEYGNLKLRSNSFIKDYKVAANFRGPEVKQGKLLNYDISLTSFDDNYQLYDFDNKSAKWKAFKKDFSLLPGEETNQIFLLTAYNTNNHIVNYFDKELDFYYKSKLENIDSLIEYGKNNFNELIRKSNKFDKIMNDVSIPQDIKSFIKWNFHIYLGNTWLLTDSDNIIFSNYEGGTGYFSTIDVEYNLALFYVLFWPELLANQIELWADIYSKGNKLRPHKFGKDHKIMEHDIGGGFKIDEQVYILGPMPIEENSNFILLNYLYYIYTGDFSLFQKYKDICLELADYIIESDLNGNGLPNRGTNNTLDCFNKMMKDMEDQIFLGVKAGSAVNALVKLLEKDGNKEREKYADFANLIFKTIEEKGWKKDHYVITIHQDKPVGWDENTPLTSNGLAYLFFTGLNIPLNLNRLKQDLQTSINDYTIWPSMGVWRDIIAQYLNINRKQKYLFRPDFRDDMYPRSFNSIGWIQAVIGLSYNIPDKIIKIKNPKNGYYPLTPMADWKKENIPGIKINDNEIEIIDKTDTLNGYQILIDEVDINDK